MYVLELQRRRSRGAVVVVVVVACSVEDGGGGGSRRRTRWRYRCAGPSRRIGGRGCEGQIFFREALLLTLQTLIISFRIFLFHVGGHVRRRAQRADVAPLPVDGVQFVRRAPARRHRGLVVFVACAVAVVGIFLRGEPPPCCRGAHHEGLHADDIRGRCDEHHVPEQRHLGRAPRRGRRRHRHSQRDTEENGECVADGAEGERIDDNARLDVAGLARSWFDGRCASVLRRRLNHGRHRVMIVGGRRADAVRDRCLLCVAVFLCRPLRIGRQGPLGHQRCRVGRHVDGRFRIHARRARSVAAVVAVRGDGIEGPLIDGGAFSVRRFDVLHTAEVPVDSPVVRHRVERCERRHADPDHLRPAGRHTLEVVGGVRRGLRQRLAAGVDDTVQRERQCHDGLANGGDERGEGAKRDGAFGVARQLRVRVDKRRRNRVERQRVRQQLHSVRGAAVVVARNGGASVQVDAQQRRERGHVSGHVAVGLGGLSPA
mmetsp:Transcript_46838/g.144452  ORF Transcript_46838/g.144452 Transcript_46838/m.144452 type:complete len:486 (+) Transcript_46838:333-1790(+)